MIENNDNESLSDKTVKKIKKKIKKLEKGVTNLIVLFEKDTGCKIHTIESWRGKGIMPPLVTFGTIDRKYYKVFDERNDDRKKEWGFYLEGLLVLPPPDRLPFAALSTLKPPPPPQNLEKDR